MRTRCQRRLVCHRVAKTSFKQLFSVQNLGMILLRRFHEKA